MKFMYSLTSTLINQVYNLALTPTYQPGYLGERFQKNSPFIFCLWPQEIRSEYFIQQNLKAAEAPYILPNHPHNQQLVGGEVDSCGTVAAGTFTPR